MQRIELQWRTEALGGWKWAKSRGHYRVVLTDPSKGATHTLNGNGLLKVLSTYGSVCGDYEGGKWGWGESRRLAQKEAVGIATRMQVEVIAEGPGANEHNASLLRVAVARAAAGDLARQYLADCRAWAYDACAEERGEIYGNEV